MAFRKLAYAAGQADTTDSCQSLSCLFPSSAGAPWWLPSMSVAQFLFFSFSCRSFFFAAGTR